MKHFMTFAFLSGLVLCCHGEEAAIPDDVFRKMSKDKTRWIANARGAKALERFRVVDDLGAPVPRARIEGVWGTPSSNAATRPRPGHQPQRTWKLTRIKSLVMLN